MSNINSTKRFSERVDDYVKYRPHYPSAIVNLLENDFGLTSTDTIVDIGSGTGISSQIFLEKGYSVLGVEPNDEMRKAGSEYLKNYPKFTANSGTAEASLLENKSVDFIIAAQAFHWFDTISVRKEFERILKPNGHVVLIWNERLISNPFEIEYDQLIIKHAIHYVKVDHRNIDLESIRKFFFPNPVEFTTFTNFQDFDFEGLKGRLLSSSYMPQKNNNGYDDMIQDLRSLFDKYQLENTIRINYDTKVYVGNFS
ncbi:class I SAM-dependent methyltransferase [Rhizosphaericola mali]|uniref:Class I SAM-dependent methyltransferase n=1 Tax=Rhizosphaericola mali TaxID=2545455 RepID=A0A5P2G1Y3_9BACT|nr:class I SAM-dependent methyltransferase [Rhizosphaericola mali]QES89465.1 class I SAM-dependent methyltransferase [Rhizosphaericola mali]